MPEVRQSPRPVPPLMYLRRPLNSEDQSLIQSRFIEGLRGIDYPGVENIELCHSLSLTVLAPYPTKKAFNIRSAASRKSTSREVRIMNEITRRHRVTVNEANPTVPVSLGPLVVYGPVHRRKGSRKVFIGAEILSGEGLSVLQSNYKEYLEKLLPDEVPDGKVWREQKIQKDNPHISIGFTHKGVAIAETARDQLNHLGILQGMKVILGAAIEH
jgi:hypothetical protein